MNADAVKRALRGGFTSKQNGTGLGLSICRHLLGAHGASLQPRIRAGQGHDGAAAFSRRWRRPDARMSRYRPQRDRHEASARQNHRHRARSRRQALAGKNSGRASSSRSAGCGRITDWPKRTAHLSPRILDQFDVGRFVKDRTLLPKGAARHTLFAVAGAVLALEDAGISMTNSWRQIVRLSPAPRCWILAGSRNATECRASARAARRQSHA